VILLDASWVLPVDGPPVREGRVAVDDAGVIRWVGECGDPASPAGTVRDLGQGVLMPGLVNAHCHLELSHVRDLAQRTGGFVEWIEALVLERGALAEDEIRRRVESAVRAVDRDTATVAIGDISNTLVSVAPLADSGLRAVVFHEVLGWDGAQAETVVAAGRERMAALPAGLDRRGVTVKLAAHAPHSVSPSLFRALRELGGPAALHVAESPSECRFLLDGGGDWPAFLGRRGLAHVPFTPPGVSPIRYLDDLGLLHEGLLAAHCVHADAADAATLAARGVSVVVCPSSNRNLAIGLAPVPTLLAAGVRVCLGTDSLASGDELDVSGEMAEVAWTFPDIPAAEVVRMATLNGARALGFDDLGRVAPGCAAALAFAESEHALDDPERYVVSGEVHLKKVELR
jgi:cytosine/adenosine deaminase-related metal-dependent hydrolase